MTPKLKNKQSKFATPKLNNGQSKYMTSKLNNGQSKYIIIPTIEYTIQHTPN